MFNQKLTIQIQNLDIQFKFSVSLCKIEWYQYISVN